MISRKGGHTLGGGGSTRDFRAGQPHLHPAISAFRKSALVYNACRVPLDSPCINVMEGFFDVFHLHQKGYPATVALMGSTASNDQIAWLQASSKHESRGEVPR